MQIIIIGGTSDSRAALGQKLFPYLAGAAAFQLRDMPDLLSNTQEPAGHPPNTLVVGNSNPEDFISLVQRNSVNVVLKITSPQTANAPDRGLEVIDCYVDWKLAMGLGPRIKHRTSIPEHASDELIQVVAENLVKS